MYQKITYGFVTQTFNDEGKCVAQEFTDGDQVEYEDMQGNFIDEPENDQDFPFDMRQPMNDREDWEN